MTRKEAIEKIKRFYGQDVVIEGGSAYKFDGELFSEMPLSALGSGDNDLYEAFRVLEKDTNRSINPAIYKDLETALKAADTENPYGYYGKDACRKLICEECGKTYYGYLGSRHSEYPYCECGVNNFWREAKLQRRTVIINGQDLIDAIITGEREVLMNGEVLADYKSLYWEDLNYLDNEIDSFEEGANPYEDGYAILKRGPFVIRQAVEINV